MFMNVCFFLVVLTCLVCLRAEAAAIQVLDQTGNPVADAVLSAPAPVNSAPGRLDSTADSAAVMDQIDKQFLPHVLTINRGQSVVFPNSDDIRHHVYSFSKPKPFEIKMYKGGESKTLQFDNPGIVVLGCNIHDQMVGYIHVGDNEVSTVTDASGWAELEITGDTFFLWHPRLSVIHSERQQLRVDINSRGHQTVTVALQPVKSPEKKRGFTPRFGNKVD
jgi:plastocyanin